MANVRVFSRPLDEMIAIAGEQFPFGPLPSGKAVHLTEMYGEDFNFEKIMGDLTSSLNDNMTTFEELNEVAKKVFDSRYKIISFGLNIDSEKDALAYERLTKAIDAAGFPEIFWVIDQILEINGVKHLEKMIKNLLSRLDKMLPDAKEPLSRLLNQFLEDRMRIRQLEQKAEEIRSTGTISSSAELEENLMESDQEMPEKIIPSTNSFISTAKEMIS